MVTNYPGTSGGGRGVSYGIKHYLLDIKRWLIWDNPFKEYHHWDLTATIVWTWLSLSCCRLFESTSYSENHLDPHQLLPEYISSSSFLVRQWYKMFILNPLALSAIALPMFPKPTRPRVEPVTCDGGIEQEIF